MTDTIDDGTDGPTDAELRDLLDAEHHRRLVEERRRRHHLAHQNGEALSFADVLAALAAHRTPVQVTTTERMLPTAQICEVGRDYVALRSEEAATRLVPIARIASATPVALATAIPTTPPLSLAPAATPPDAFDLAERLRDLATRRARLHLSVAGTPVRGRLRAIGTDVAIIEHEGTDRFVALGALDEVVVLP